MKKNCNKKELKLVRVCNDLEIEDDNNNIGIWGYKHGTKEYSKNYEQDGETYRTRLRRQRDKILYAGGFRRLQGKTQVKSSNSNGDHRTRLTHTLEVEQIAISIANSLRLNTDLTSAIALGHDIGHTPFAHAAEATLNDLLLENGGFHHPIQSFLYIWNKYGDIIDDVIYEGILQHDSDMQLIDKDTAENQVKYGFIFDHEKKTNDKNIAIEYLKSGIKENPRTLESQVVIWADKIAYITHDLEDFLNSSIYTSLEEKDSEINEELSKILNVFLSKLQELENKGTELEIKAENFKAREFSLRDLLRSLTTNLIVESCKNIKDFENNFEEIEMPVREVVETGKVKIDFLNKLIINFDDDFRKSFIDLREFIDQKYIFSPEVQRSDAKAKIIIKSLFLELTNDYNLLPIEIQNNINDYIELEAKNKYKYIYNSSNGNIRKFIREFEKTTKENKELLEKKLKQTDENRQEIDKLKELDKEFQDFYKIKKNIIERNVACYISTMTDTYALSIYRDLYSSNDDFNW